ncbi:GntR family transcriptional regulator [Phyllobacterium sp. OV277]|jgi:DNA-binding GntR family transcriptional regulator|uniref:GntR family transcriptional regulator n=1 Tax=Phyllobacterium sp. OV277 TaxID=1882772 RepID=UPI0008894AB4|nr:GntR family transcriptional regulator [Phyllobacterium sp. OV277]SDP33972.1 transcriptional regulator, GntR family [Phyllobacterium sp. OV277]
MKPATDAFPVHHDGQDDRSQLIREALYNAIVERRLAPGTKLVETEVGKLFDVSRTVVRAALQMLAFEGLVKIERNRGAFVAYPTPDEARQIFESRRVIEPEIAERAAERITSADIKLFQAHLKEEERLLVERGPNARRAAIKASGDYHLMLASVAGNLILERFMRELIARSSLVIALYGQSGASSCARSEHADILDALMARDSKKAADAIRHHIDHIEEDLDYKVVSNSPLRDALRV